MIPWLFRRSRITALALALVAGCALLPGAAPSYRTFDAPMTRVKPAMISTLATLGIRIVSLEVRGGHEIIRAKRPGGEVEIELERVNRSATRVRVAASSGGLLHDNATAARIILLTERILGNA